MSHMPPGDPFVENVLRSVPADVARILTTAQWGGLRHALKHARSRTSPVIDVRFVIPLYFVRLYAVFLLGQDRRASVARVLHERRSQASRVAVAAFLAALFVFVVVVLFLLLYVLKSAAGIDIFPNFHLFAWSHPAEGPVMFPRDLLLL